MAKYLDFSGLRRFKNKLGEIFQSKLISGTNIKTINNESILGSGDISISSPTKTSDLINDSGFINKDVNDLTHYTLAVDAGSFIDLDINSTTYVVTLSLKNSSGTVISSDSIDLPLESVVVNGDYDSTNKKIVLTLQSGSTIDIPVGDLISGLQTEITSSNKLASDLVDDTNQVNKFVSTTEKSTWNAKQDALVSGVNIKTVNDESIVGSGNLEIEVPTKTSDLTNDSGFIDELVILSYGHSTWAEFMAAYSKNLVIYCRASSNSNPGTGSQNRLAFLAYVSGDSANPTEVEFQYYRSVSSHTITQQGDQMYVYKLNRNSNWTVTVRESYTKITAGNYLTGTYSNSNLTLDVTGVQEELVSGTNIKTINNESILGSGDIDTSVSWGDIDGTLSDQSDLNSAFNSKQDTLISGTNIKTINNESILGSGDIQISGSDSIYYVDTNGSTNPFYFSGKKKGLYFFNRSLQSIYYTFDETTRVISEPLGLSHYIAILNDVPADVAEDTVLGYYVKYATASDRYTDYPVTVSRKTPGLYDTGLYITSYSTRTYVSKDTAQTISGKKTFSTLPESSVVPTTDDQLTNKKYVDDSLSSKQDLLVSGSNIKTINNESILGSGDISITGELPSITTTTNIWELNQGVYDVGPSVNLYYKSGGYVTTSSYGVFLFVGHEANSRRTFYLMGRDPLTSSSNYNYIYVGVAQNNNYGVIDGYNLYNLTTAVTLYDNQTISSKKTFSTLPESSVVPTTNNQLVNKNYVDNSFFDVVAPNYSSSSTYDVGDFVIYNGLMYVCNTTISTAEAWDSTHWTQTSVNENFGGGSTPLDDIPTFDFTSYTWPAYNWNGRYAPTGNNFQKSTARALYDRFVEVVSAGKKTYIGYTGVAEYPFIYPYEDNYSKYINRAVSSTVTYGFKLPICSPQVTNSVPFVVGFVVASFQVKYDENKDFVEIVTNPYPQWWYSQTAYAVQDLTGTFRYTIGSSSSDRYVPVYRMYVEDNFLSKTNTTSYTPTTSYNPATKKYVDDHSGSYNVSSDGTETKAGYQIDGQDVYVKRFVLNSVVNGSSVAHGLTNFTLVDYTAMANIDGVYRKLPYASGVFYVVDVTSTDISFFTNNSSYTSANLTVSIFYTKNV